MGSTESFLTAQALANSEGKALAGSHAQTRVASRICLSEEESETRRIQVKLVRFEIVQVRGPGVLSRNQCLCSFLRSYDQEVGAVVVVTP